jgi:hypothetical protein
MELSSTIASMAVVLGVVVATGFAVGENNVPAPTKTVEKKSLVEKNSLDEQQKRREHFERACNKPLRTDNDRETCRAAYRAL